MRLDLWGVWGDGGTTKMSRDRPNMMLMKEPPTRLRELAVTDAA